MTYPNIAGILISISLTCNVLCFIYLVFSIRRWAKLNKELSMIIMVTTLIKRYMEDNKYKWTEDFKDEV